MEKNRCLICLGDLSGQDRYHARCSRLLFGLKGEPGFDIDPGKLHTAALAMVGHTSLSGVQKKISVNLSVDRRTLQVASGSSQFILKPQTGVYPALPENEHITMQLAKLSGLDTGVCGLVELKDGSLGFIVRRFDRLADGVKVRQEDFCQLSEKSPKQKYEGSAELCVRILREFATEPLVETLKLYRQLVFCWWIGNGDVHLKNLSLLVDSAGVIRLTPAYDLVCTRLVIPDDKYALSVGGNNDQLNRGRWLRFAEYSGIPVKTATRVLDEQAAFTVKAVELIERSFLPVEMKQVFQELIRHRGLGLS
jgi:serine/threonine-protein kinase HipA